MQIVVAVIAVFALVSALLVVWIKARRRRQAQGQNTHKDKRWPVFYLLGRKRFGQGRYEQTSAENPDGESQVHQLESTAASSRSAADQSRHSHHSRGRATPATRIGASVDRNTSVRSVMTLPAYQATAGNNEQVLGREGDRDGVDIIIDLPTAEEEESLRDNEMEALYQIRVARREQIAELDVLRRERRDARRRGDSHALEAARTRTRAASNNSNFDGLRQEVSSIQDRRQRSVSSVSYADLGVARHDGTRLRANSNESERMGLLSDAASIAISTRSELRSPGLHRRDRSASSLVSVDSELRAESSSRVRVHSQSATPRLSGGETGLGSSPELVEADLGVEAIPPPEYEDVSLEDSAAEAAQSTIPLNELPPDYSGLNQHISQTEEATTESADPASREAGTLSAQGASRGVGGIPQLPSLRVPGLPAIVVQPTNEDSREHDH